MHDQTTSLDYKLANGFCELQGLILNTDRSLFEEMRDNPWKIANSTDDSPVETNHIWSIGRRPNYWSNLIDLSPPMHHWFHRNLTIGRVACLYRKWLKGGRDWEVADLDKASGRSVIGWLEILDLPEPFATWRTAIVQHPAGSGSRPTI
jgi:hypothetical protein